MVVNVPFSLLQPKTLIIPDAYISTTADKQEMEDCALKPVRSCFVHIEYVLSLI